MMIRMLAFRKFEQSTLKTGIHGIIYERKFRFSKDSYMARYVVRGTKNYTENKTKLNPSFEFYVMIFQYMSRPYI